MSCVNFVNNNKMTRQNVIVQPLLTGEYKTLLCNLKVSLYLVLTFSIHTQFRNPLKINLLKQLPCFCHPYFNVICQKNAYLNNFMFYIEF